MNSEVKRWLRYADRALRPRAAAVRVLASETAANNSLIRDLAAEIHANTEALRASHPTPATESVAEQSDEVDDLSAASTAALAAESISTAEVDGIPNNHLYDLWTAEVIRRVLSSGSGSALDVGAHRGEILEWIVQAAPGQRHHAFEPIPAMAADLRTRFPGVSVHQVALAAESGSGQFHHVISNPSYSGILQRSYHTSDETVQLIDVELRRLDDLVDPKDPVLLLKIDVEGAELGVLKGAFRTLEDWKPVVIFEFGLGASDVYGTTPEDIFEEFSSHGMSLTLLNRWLRGAEPMSFEEFENHYSTGRNYYFLAYAN